jgi:hypothetical protein
VIVYSQIVFYDKIIEISSIANRIVYPFIIRPNPFITSASAIACASVEDDGIDDEGVSFF